MGLGRGRPGGRTGVNTRANWRPARIRGQHRNDSTAWIQLDTDVYGMADGIVQQAGKDIEDAYKAHILPFFRRVQRDWPQPGNAIQATGYSRSRLSLIFDAEGNVLRASVKNGAFYAGFIRQARHGNKKAVDRVVFKPIDPVVDELAADIGDRLSR